MVSINDDILSVFNKGFEMKGQAYEKMILSMGGPVKSTKLAEWEKDDYRIAVLGEPEETRKQLCKRFFKSLT